MVSNLRNSSNYIINLIFILKLNNESIGYLLFTKVILNNEKVLALAPIAISKKCQNNGLETLLISDSINEIKKLNYPLILVLGDPKFYKKFNFLEALLFNITCPFNVDLKYFLALKLVNKDFSGTPIYTTVYRNNHLPDRAEEDSGHKNICIRTAGL